MSLGMNFRVDPCMIEHGFYKSRFWYVRRNALNRSPVLTVPWASRTFHFSDDQVFWDCNELNANEA
jgi:hypothetical protein